MADDSVGDSGVVGSRLIPAATYRDSPAIMGKAYQKLLESGALTSVLSLPVKSLRSYVVIVVAEWDDSASLAEISQIRHHFQNVQAPFLDELIAKSGASIDSYFNEADMLERNFQTTVFGLTMRD
ncbi:hypothetical protein MSAN_02049200 [Mycena sanguinolenta]|uniref:Uncharacterized protein n=1 Tax=Mycena sanguinolenta TaxID=230812 RepID=A0A8H6XK33_9AGAR|nr:hypothetical protein MSAN_02049200 [Mycena sanguinolenta]